MPQVFSRRFTLAIRLALIASTVAAVGAALAYRASVRADAPRDDFIEQPIPFSHQHHARDDGIDCRYCHTSVDAARGLKRVPT